MAVEYMFGEMSIQVLCSFSLICSLFHKRILRSYYVPVCTVLRTDIQWQTKLCPHLQEDHRLISCGGVARKVISKLKDSKFYERNEQAVLREHGRRADAQGSNGGRRSRD